LSIDSVVQNTEIRNGEVIVRKQLAALFLVAIAFVVGLSSAWAVRVGEHAPDFTATDSNGQVHKLSNYQGRFVVLEWTNRGCPYTQKHYNSGNMQRLQREWTSRGVVWLTVLSSAPGKQGYATGPEENAYLKQVNSTPTAALLDPTGALGHLYDAKTSPHMFIINPQGILLYNGAIDDRPTTDVADVATAKNYISIALEEATSGKPLTYTTTRPYGCSVKYPD
jgi:AhpC/TSA family